MKNKKNYKHEKEPVIIPISEEDAEIEEDYEVSLEEKQPINITEIKSETISDKIKNSLFGNKDQEIKKLKDELINSESNYIQLLADFKNYKKRNEGSLKEAREKEKIDFIYELLDVVDNFDRCLNNNLNLLDDGSRKGIEAIYNQILQILEKHDIHLIETKDIAFNPELHEAISVSKDKDKQDGIINEVYQKGFMVGNTLLRPAKVSVIKND